jgi:hypothetical protein
MKSNILDAEMIPTWDGSVCPSDAVLISYLNEETPEEMTDEINAHTFTCASCRAFCDTIIGKEHDKFRRENNRNKTQCIVLHFQKG